MGDSTAGVRVVGKTLRGRWGFSNNCDGLGVCGFGCVWVWVCGCVGVGVWVRVCVCVGGCVGVGVCAS